MTGGDGVGERITVENPMLEVTCASKEEKYIFVGSFVRRLERECERTYELIPAEDVDMRAAFQTVHVKTR